MTGSFSRSLESPFRVAQLALNIKMNDLDKDYYKNYLKTLNTVSIKDIYTAAQKYMKPNNCNIVIVGNKDIAHKLEVFDADKKITYYDFQGEIVNMEKKAIKEGVTAESIIEKRVVTPNKTHAVLFEVNGEVASPYQFITTDSTRNFLRAALYLDNPVANDSIMPVIEYLKNDVNHILNTLVWDGR